jgi:hypothetical protein
VDETPWPPDRDPLRKLVLVGLVVVVLACGGYGVVAWRANSAADRPGATATSGPPVDPYSGTPAEHYPHGIAGIALPEARALGTFTAVDVGDALILVRAALVAGRIDERMVVQRDPTDFVALLAETERARVRQQFASGAFASYATQVAPGHPLAGTEPRVKGRIEFRLATGTVVPAIEVMTNFVWVYAFANQVVVVVHDEVTWRVYDYDSVFADQRGLWLVDSDVYLSNMDCALIARALLAPAPAPTRHGDNPQDPAALYDPDRSLDVASTC